MAEYEESTPGIWQRRTEQLGDGLYMSCLRRPIGYVNPFNITTAGWVYVHTKPWNESGSASTFGDIVEDYDFWLANAGWLEIECCAHEVRDAHRHPVAQVPDRL